MHFRCGLSLMWCGRILLHFKSTLFRIVHQFHLFDHRPKGFSKWFDHIKDSLSQENPEETNLVRLGIKKWRKMTTDEKKPWM